MDINPNEIKQYLEGINFPIAKEDLASQMRDKGAPDMLVGFVEKLPMDEIQSPGEIFKAINPFD